MNILAIDSSSEYLMLGVATKDNVYLQQLKIANRHSEVILPEIDKLLQAAQLTPNHLNLLAYNYGPGSFTGLRIGLSCALGIAYAHNLNLAAVSSFMLYADDTTKQFPYLGVCLDARLNQIYCAIINQDDFSYLQPPCLINPEELVGILDSQPMLNSGNCLLTGNAFAQYQEAISHSGLEEYQIYAQGVPNARRMLGLCQLGHYQEFTAMNAELMYVRNKVALNLAEQQRNKQL